MRKGTNVRRRLSILSKAIEDVYGNSLSSFYSEIRDKGEICFIPHPLLAISIMIDEEKASVIVKESECVTLPGTIKTIREFNATSVLDICEFIEDMVDALMLKINGTENIKEIDESRYQKRGWFSAILNRLGLMRWWEGVR